MSRDEYRLRMQQRQTIIFGAISGFMVLSLIVALLIWTGLVPAPFDPEFSGKRSNGNELVIPCLDDDTQAVPLSHITVTVYNGTSRTGLAASAGQQLTSEGVVVTNTANWSQQALKGSAKIIAGKDGIPAAYTIAAHIPGAVVQYDPDVTDEILSIVLGADFDRVLTLEEINKANPGGILESQEGCVPVGKGKAR